MKMGERKEKKEPVNEVDTHVSRKYEIRRRIGKGAYGIVWKATDRKNDTVVAVKKIFDAFRNETDAQRTFREIVFLLEFSAHPNVIRLLNVLKAENNKDIYLVFQYMETDLHNVIRKGGVLEEIHHRYIMYQLFRAIKYLHSGSVIHRDLKPSNVLINSDCKIKVADFGLARSIESLPSNDIGDPTLTNYVATRWYRAPEILLNSKNYTVGIDMWSLGCILAEMVLGNPLFPGTSTLDQIEKIMNAISKPTNDDLKYIPSQLAANLDMFSPNKSSRKSLRTLLKTAIGDEVNLIESLLLFNPNKRLTASQALKHSYVAKFHNAQNEPELKRAVLPCISDDIQLSVDSYRNKLYELIAMKKTRDCKNSKTNEGNKNGSESGDNETKFEERTMNSKSDGSEVRRSSKVECNVLKVGKDSDIDNNVLEIVRNYEEGNNDLSKAVKNDRIICERNGKTCSTNFNYEKGTENFSKFSVNDKKSSLKKSSEILSVLNSTPSDSSRSLHSIHKGSKSPQSNRKYKTASIVSSKSIHKAFKSPQPNHKDQTENTAPSKIIHKGFKSPQPNHKYQTDSIGSSKNFHERSKSPQPNHKYPTESYGSLKNAYKESKSPQTNQKCNQKSKLHKNTISKSLKELKTSTKNFTLGKKTEKPKIGKMNQNEKPMTDKMDRTKSNSKPDLSYSKSLGLEEPLKSELKQFRNSMEPHIEKNKPLRKSHPFLHSKSLSESSSTSGGSTENNSGKSEKVVVRQRHTVELKRPLKVTLFSQPGAGQSILKSTKPVKDWNDIFQSKRVTSLLSDDR